jgi:hypothetical protein
LGRAQKCDPLIFAFNTKFAAEEPAFRWMQVNLPKGIREVEHHEFDFLAGLALPHQLECLNNGIKLTRKYDPLPFSAAKLDKSAFSIQDHAVLDLARTHLGYDPYFAENGISLDEVL